MSEETKGPDAAVVERVAEAIASQNSRRPERLALMALAALKPGDELGSGKKVWEEKHFLAGFESGRQQAAEKMRERCAQTVREWGSDYPGSRLVAAILALEVE